MAEFPIMPLAIDAYLGDTKHLTTIEHGTYLLLLMSMWRAGGDLPNDDRTLARIAGVGPQQWARMRSTIMAFMVQIGDGTRITQARLIDEITGARSRSKKQSENARSRWRNHADPPVAVKRQPERSFNGDDAKSLEENASSDAAAMPSQCHGDAPIPIPIKEEKEPSGSLSETEISDAPASRRKRNEYPAEFEAVWQRYPTDQNMSKSKTYVAWKRLRVDDRPNVTAAIPAFIAYCQKNPDYRPVHMVRFISERRFDGFLGAGPRLVVPTEDWQRRLEWARQKRCWASGEWGPAPGRPGCLAPADLLSTGDGDGWTEFSRSAA